MSTYRSAAGRSAILAAYEDWLSRLPVTAKRRLVSTRLGDTHLLALGSPSAAGNRIPLVLLSGTSFPALSWERVLPLLARSFALYAVDLVGQPGPSAPTRPRHAGYAGWLVDVLDALGLPVAHLVGHSLGGRVALQAASAHPGRIERLALIFPAGLIRLRVTSSVLAATIRWQLRPSPAASSALLSLMADRGAAVDSGMVTWMTLVARHVRTSLAPPPLPAPVLRRVRAPALLLAGGQDPFLPGYHLAAVTGHRLTEVEADVVLDGRHLLPHDRHVLVADRISRFMDAAE